MSDFLTMSIDDMDFDFENMLTKITAARNIQELKVMGVDIGPLKEGKELETRYWIASQLVSSGFAIFQNDEFMTFNILYKIHWKETKLQTGRRISSLPEHFYPRLRRYLNQLKEKTTKDATRVNEYNNALRLAHDVVNCRLKKIINLSASSIQTEDVLQNLTREERILYSNFYSAVSEWKSKILKAGVIK